MKHFETCLMCCTVDSSPVMINTVKSYYAIVFVIVALLIIYSGKLQGLKSNVSNERYPHRQLSRI